MGINFAATWFDWLHVISMLALAYDAFVTKTHRRLQPWCPWCRRRGDLDWTFTQVPPVGAVAK